MIKIAICDDEQYYLEKVKKVVTNYFEKSETEYQIELYHSGDDLIRDIENLKLFHILFIDINMKDTDGITAAKEIRRANEDIYIAFITSFVDYSLEGYKVNAIRYIIKDSLEAALPECIKAILEKMKLSTETIEVYISEQKIFILISKIMFIESDKHKILIHICDGKDKNRIISLYRKLDDMEIQLRDKSFIRIHKSFLINAKYIYRINNYKVEMITGELFNIAREKYSFVRQQYAQYKGKE